MPTKPLTKASTTPVDASTLSFRLDGDTGGSPSSSKTPPGGFSPEARCGAAKETVVLSLLGNASTAKDPKEDDEVEIIFEATAGPADVARARELKLPDNFFLYETKTPCPGCRGCDDGDNKKKALEASRPAALEKSPSTKDAPHLSAADRTTGSLEDEGSVGADDVAPSVDIYFQPVVPLPELVELRSGEEDEEQLFCHRAKLFVFDSQVKHWKERAIGDIKILKHKTRLCCFRVLMRTEQVHKIACNHYITEFTKLSPMSTSSTSLTWLALDFSEGETSPETFAVRFKNAEVMDKFAKVFEECRLAVGERGSQPAGSERNGDLEREQVEDMIRKKEEDVVEDDEDDDEDDEHGEDIMFERRVTLSVQRPGTSAYESLGMGNLRMVYDNSCFGARIRVIADDGSLLCDTIVAVQTCLRTERLHAYWSAVDMSIDPILRRHFQAAFSSPQAIAEFSRIFAEAKDLAVNSSIVESIDEPPSPPK